LAISKDDFENLSEDEKKAYIEMFSHPKENTEHTALFTSGWPKTAGQFFAGMFGLPIERHARGIQHPITIFSFIALFVAIHLISSSVGEEVFVNTWGFIPAEFYRMFFIPMFSSFFLHGSWAHLVGNAYYFYVFGDDVEDDMKLSSFMLLLFGGHLFGMILHGLLSAATDLPTVGASAGISAIMGYYMIRFPKRQITYMIFFFYFWIHIPAFFAFLWKFGWEFLTATADSGASGDVALWAHVGGAVFGAVFALGRKKDNNLIESPKGA